MKILLLNANNPLRESGIVALDLFNNLKENGHEVKLLVNSYNSNYPEGIENVEPYYSWWLKNKLAKVYWTFKRLKNLLRKQRNKNSDYYFFLFKEKTSFFKTNNLLKKSKIKPDVIILLFVKGFINTKNIYELYKKTHAPIYWLMYDMAPLTGGCHYSWDCLGYQNRCGSCPGLFSTDPYDFSYKNFSHKKFFIEKTDINIITASEWQFRQAKGSSLFKNKRIHKILIPVNPYVFKPVNKEEKRREMNIPVNKKVIYFGAIDLTEGRKGMKYLIEGLNYLKDRINVDDSNLEKDIFLLVAGQSFDGIANSLPFESHYLGYLDNLEKLASAYQVADVFICPSIEDSGPTMINQSIMSGTPVVSFEMGVSLDLVITGETGYRAKLRDSIDMAHGIYEILTLNKVGYKKLSSNCRKLALELCSPMVQMELLEDLFKKAELQ